MSEKIELLVRLIKAYESYIELLSEELNEVVPIASIHGWRSVRYEKGEVLRNEIESIKEQLHPSCPLPDADSNETNIKS